MSKTRMRWHVELDNEHPSHPWQTYRCTWFSLADWSVCTSCVATAATILGDSGGKVNIWEIIVPVLVRNKCI